MTDRVELYRKACAFADQLSHYNHHEKIANNYHPHVELVSLDKEVVRHLQPTTLGLMGLTGDAESTEPRTNLNFTLKIIDRQGIDHSMILASMEMISSGPHLLRAILTDTQGETWGMKIEYKELA